jgi:hypothetical protein
MLQIARHALQSLDVIPPACAGAVPVAATMSKVAGGLVSIFSC